MLSQIFIKVYKILSIQKQIKENNRIPIINDLLLQVSLIYLHWCCV